MHTRWLSRPPTRQGFTLVELIVVLAIFSVLMLILVPAIHSTRSQSRRIERERGVQAWHSLMPNLRGKSAAPVTLGKPGKGQLANMVTCSSCTSTPTCSYQTVVSGTLGGTGDDPCTQEQCNTWNGTYIVEYVNPCMYEQGVLNSQCGPVVKAKLLIDSSGMWFRLVAPNNYQWVCWYSSSTDCASPNTLTLIQDISGRGKCSNLPTNITLTPLNCP